MRVQELEFALKYDPLWLVFALVSRTVLIQIWCTLQRTARTGA